MDVEDLQREWQFTRGLTLDLLDALSEADLQYQPGPGMGPFWKQFRHIGGIQESYMEAIYTRSVRFTLRDKRYHQGPDRDALHAYLAGLDRELENLVATIDDERTINWGNERISLEEHLMRLINHETLHQGEWVVYMRLLDRPFPAGWSAWGL